MFNSSYHVFICITCIYIILINLLPYTIKRRELFSFRFKAKIVNCNKAGNLLQICLSRMETKVTLSVLLSETRFKKIAAFEKLLLRFLTHDL